MISGLHSISYRMFVCVEHRRMLHSPSSGAGLAFDITVRASVCVVSEERDVIVRLLLLSLLPGHRLKREKERKIRLLCDH